MSTNIVNQSPFLRTSRNFPLEAQPLAVEVNRSYVDIAEKMNDRSIGLFPSARPAQTGDKWYLTSAAQAVFRQVFPFQAAGNIPHGITWISVAFISPSSYGTFTDGTNWCGAIYGSGTAIAGQLSFYVTSTNIVVLAGAGAPSITQGYINLEWVSQV
jgi:PPE-repeat protein